ncbi:hypothetical protein Bbelb_264070 [Branchiostoma belcheri]|nr:hypothetical protein Bbelb_264070 [Branchiostoma belcheri]
MKDVPTGAALDGRRCTVECVAGESETASFQRPPWQLGRHDVMCFLIGNFVPCIYRNGPALLPARLCLYILLTASVSRSLLCPAGEVGQHSLTTSPRLRSQGEQLDSSDNKIRERAVRSSQGFYPSVNIASTLADSPCRLRGLRVLEKEILGKHHGYRPGLVTPGDIHTGRAPATAPHAALPPSTARQCLE